jgi:branched-chain amino acid transport system substrate-binding protein
MIRSRAGAAALACAVMAVALGACGSDDNGPDTATSTATPATTTAAPAASGDAASGVSQGSIDFGVQFTGGTAGRADAGMDPVTIGFINQQGGTPAFPEYADAADAAVKFVNEHLGGVGGHPLKLQKCIVQTEEDGQKCASEILSNKKIFLTNWSLAVVGGASFYKIVAPKQPIVISAAANSYDSTTENVWGLDGGGRSVLNGMTQDAKQRGAKTLALVGSSNPAGKDSYVNIVIPQLKQLGIKYKAVYVPDTATTPDIASALQASGAKTADAIVLNLASAGGCNSTFDALKQLGITTPVITTTQCNADEFIDHVGGGGAPNWDLFGFGTNPREDDPQAAVYRNVMEAYGQKDKMFVGFVTKSFGDILHITKWANTIGYDKLSVAAFEQQIKDWRGPGFMLPGEFHCGANTELIGICGDSASGSTFKDGKFVSVGDFKLGG